MRSTRVLNDCMVNSFSQVVGEREVEERVDAVLALLRRDLGDASCPPDVFSAAICTS